MATTLAPASTPPKHDQGAAALVVLGLGAVGLAGFLWWHSRGTPGSVRLRNRNEFHCLPSSSPTIGQQAYDANDPRALRGLLPLYRLGPNNTWQDGGTIAYGSTVAVGAGTRAAFVVVSGGTVPVTMYPIAGGNGVYVSATDVAQPPGPCT